MNAKLQTKYIHWKNLVAEMEVMVIEDPDGFGSTISLEDAKRIDAVRRALRDQDLELASSLAKVYRMQPLAG